jgi:hypothetical protein
MDALTSLSNFTGGMESFGEAGQLMAAASGYKQNARLLELSGKGELAAGELAARRVAVQGEKYVSRQRSMYAKAGVKFTGSPAAMWAESERNAQLDIVNTKLNAAARANAYGFGALQARMAAGRARTAAWAKGSQGLLKIGTQFALQAEAAQKADGLKLMGKVDTNRSGTASPSEIESYIGR